MDWGEGGVVPEGIPMLDIGPEFPLLRAAVTRFAGRVEPAFNAAQVGEQIVHLSHTRDIISRELAKLTGAFGATDEADRQGANSAVDWVRIQSRMSVAEAAQLGVVGRHLQELPLSSGALDEGRIGFGHLVHLARNAAFSAGSAGSFDEVPLLPRAEDETVNAFGIRVSTPAMPRTRRATSPPRSAPSKRASSPSTRWMTGRHGSTSASTRPRRR